MKKGHQRRADCQDAEVGLRIRSRRLELGLSQTDLGGAIGVTFQQVQKVEKGVNRISASRLQRTAATLKVPVSYFFDGSDAIGTSRDAKSEGAPSVFSMLQTSGSVRIVKAFSHIKSRKARQLLVEMAEELATKEAA